MSEYNVLLGSFVHLLVSLLPASDYTDYLLRVKEDACLNFPCIIVPMATVKSLKVEYVKTCKK